MERIKIGEINHRTEGHSDFDAKAGHIWAELRQIMGSLKNAPNDRAYCQYMQEVLGTYSQMFGKKLQNIHKTTGEREID